MGVVFEEVRTAPSNWDASEVTVPLQVALDACFVPSAHGLRVDEAHLVVIDGQLDDFKHSATKASKARKNEDRLFRNKSKRPERFHADGLIDSKLQKELLKLLTDDEQAPEPPQDRWELHTVDDAATGGAHPSWGFKDEVLRALKHQPAVIELHSRLQKMYPEVNFYHMPADDMQVPQPSGAEKESLADTAKSLAKNTKAAGANEEPSIAHKADTQSHVQRKRQRDSKQDNPSANANSFANDSRSESIHKSIHGNQKRKGLCQQFVANAAVKGDHFVWHVDADPADVPCGSPWVEKFGLYANRDPGKPRLVSIIAYLPSAWGLNEHAETLFLDSATDTGVCVRPRPGRVVVMDQDVMHRVSVPSAAARRPRYSLVWKLALLNKGSSTSPSPFTPNSNKTPPPASCSVLNQQNSPDRSPAMCQNCGLDRQTLHMSPAQAQKTLSEKPDQQILGTDNTVDKEDFCNQAYSTEPTAAAGERRVHRQQTRLLEACAVEQPSTEHSPRTDLNAARKKQKPQLCNDRETLGQCIPGGEKQTQETSESIFENVDSMKPAVDEKLLQSQQASLFDACELAQSTRRSPGTAAGGKQSQQGNRNAQGDRNSKKKQPPPAILLPSMGSVCYFGSARRMRDVQDNICGGR